MFYIYLLLAKLTNFIIETLHLGAGYTWPGHFVLTLNSKILADPHLNLVHGYILISGTNGKTTTAKLISHLLIKSGYKVVTNSSGANLLNGIVSALLLNFSWLGRARATVGVFEVDEFNLPLFMASRAPSVLVLLNLSRDQLDRYGEVDIVLARWQECVVSYRGLLVVDGTQELLCGLQTLGKVLKFEASLEALEGTSLVGSFNARNVTASLLAVQGLTLHRVSPSLLSDFRFAFGRGEILTFAGVSFKLLLAKNPASFESNLTALLDGSLGLGGSAGSHPVQGLTLHFILNDNIPDGRDISWIYDIDPLLLTQACNGNEVFVSGTRAWEMAVRLQYAGVALNKEHVYTNSAECLARILQKNKGETVIAFPNYSAMLELRNQLVGRKIL